MPQIDESPLTPAARLAILGFLAKWGTGVATILTVAATLVGTLVFSSIQDKGENAARMGADHFKADFEDWLKRKQGQVDDAEKSLRDLEGRAREHTAKVSEIVAAASKAGERADALSSAIDFQTKRLPRAVEFLEAIQKTQDQVDVLAKKIAEDPSIQSLVKGLSGGAPVGAIVAWPGELGSIPPGWAVCDGREIPAGANVDALVAVLRDRYGVGRLPDLRGMFLRGVDDPDGAGGRAAAAVDADAAFRTSHVASTVVGDVVGSRQVDGTRPPHVPFQISGGPHDHYTLNSADTINLAGGPGNTGGRLKGVNHADMGDGAYSVWRRTPSRPPNRNPDELLDGGHTHSFGLGAEGAGGDRETRPVNVSVNWIIKVR